MSRKGIKNFTTDAEREAAAERRKETRRRYTKRPEIKARLQVKEQLRAADKRAYAKRRHAENSTLISAQQKKFRATPKGRALHLVNAAKKRSRQSGTEVSVPVAFVEWALIAGICMRTGIKFDFGSYGSRAAFAPSLDRKDPSKGYTLDNTEVVCNAFNLAKSEWDYSVMATWIEAVRSQVWYQKLLHQK
jgi:hypothetical protein